MVKTGDAVSYFMKLPQSVTPYVILVGRGLATDAKVFVPEPKTHFARCHKHIATLPHIPTYI